MLRKLSWIMVVLLGVFLGQCTNDNGPVSPNDPVRDITPSEKTLIESSNEFGLRLFREITSTEGNTNVFISPLSVSMALGMTYNGADGKTREEMADLLGLSGMTITEANQAYQSLIELLHGLDPEVAFSIANSIWLRQDFPVKEEFIDLNQTFFDAEVTTLDFGDPGAKDTINNWVDMKTNGKIPRIVDNINPLTMLFLINAIYFKGNWTQMFDSLGTHEEDFITVDGTKTLCNMMSQENTFPYFANDTFQAIDLTYGNGDFSMAIILPRHGVELDSLIEEFTPENWDTWRGSFVESEVQLYLPRFKLEYKLLLNDILIALGMREAFVPFVADFTKIADVDDLHISKVLHKTFVDVNETGTEAAAVTIVEVGTTSIENPPIIVRVDRPFIFVIRDHHSGTMLFMGRIVEPSLD